MTYRTKIAAIATGATLALSGGAFAQDATDEMAPLEQQDFEADQLDAWVVAFFEVMSVRERYDAPLQAAETEEQQIAIIEEANTEIMAAIEDVNGMDIDTYEEIAMALQSDPELAERLTRRIEEQGAI